MKPDPNRISKCILHATYPLSSGFNRSSFGASGIYSIVNQINGKVYIGAAKDIARRFMSHAKCLESNRHPNKKLQYDFNQEGSNAFLIQVLEFCSLDDMRDSEQRLIEKYNALHPEFGYNSSKSAYSKRIEIDVNPADLVSGKGFLNADGKMYQEDFLRFLSARVKQYGTQEKFARICNVSPAYLSDVLQGRREPGSMILDTVNMKKTVRYVVRYEELEEGEA